MRLSVLRKLNERLGALERQTESLAAPHSEAATLAESLPAFLKAAWHVVEPSTALVLGWHLDAICEHLEAVLRGQIQNLAITLPPGCTKSITIGVVFPVWWWATDPSTRFLCAANEESLAIRDAVASRRLIDSDWFRSRFGHVFRLTSDQNTKGWFENDRRGFRTTTTVGSTVTGKKCDVMIVDDPNDAKEVFSDAECKNVNDWFDMAMFDRVNDFLTSRRILVGHRNRRHDLIGHALASGLFEELRLPEEFVPARRCTTSIGWSDPRTVEGELLRPTRFDDEQVQAARRRLGPIRYRAKHQQDPQDDAGSKFKREWFRWYEVKGRLLYLQRPDGPFAYDPRAGLRFATVDHAASTKRTADWTVISVWGQTPKAELVWLDCVRVQKEIPDIVPLLQEVQMRWTPKWVGIEAVAGNRGVPDLARQARNPSIPVRDLTRRAGEDKLVRATEAIAFAAAGRLYLPANVPGFPVDAVIEELTTFTGTSADEHDDVVDTVADAANAVCGVDPDHKPGLPFVVPIRGGGISWFGRA